MRLDIFCCCEIRCTCADLFLSHRLSARARSRVRGSRATRTQRALNWPPHVHTHNSHYFVIILSITLRRRGPSQIYTHTVWTRVGDSLESHDSGVDAWVDATSVMMTATSPARAPKEPTAWSTLLASDVEAHPSENRPTALVVPASAASVEQASRRPAPSGTRGSSCDRSHATRGPKHSSSRSRAPHAPLPLRRSCPPRRLAASTARAATASKSAPSHSTCAQGAGAASEAGARVEARAMAGEGEARRPSHSMPICTSACVCVSTLAHASGSSSAAGYTARRPVSPSWLGLGLGLGSGLG